MYKQSDENMAGGNDVSATSSDGTISRFDIVSKTCVRPYIYNASQPNSQVAHLRPIANSVSRFRPNGTLSTYHPSTTLSPLQLRPSRKLSIPSDSHHACATSGPPNPDFRMNVPHFVQRLPARRGPRHRGRWSCDAGHRHSGWC